MSNIKLDYQLPHYAIKHIEKIRILFAVNSETKQSEAFVPMSMYLELLNKVENLSSKQITKEATDGTNL